MRARRLRAVALLLGGTWLGGCTEPHVPVAAGQQQETQAPEYVVAVDEPQSAPTPETAVSGYNTVRPPPPLRADAVIKVDPNGSTRVSEVRSVVFDFDVEGVATPSELALELVTPRGSSYERHVQALREAPFDTQHATFDVPVAGTMIDTSRLHGQWTARYFVNGTEVGTQTFELTP